MKGRENRKESVTLEVDLRAEKNFARMGFKHNLIGNLFGEIFLAEFGISQIAGFWAIVRVLVFNLEVLMDRRDNWHEAEKGRLFKLIGAAPATAYSPHERRRKQRCQTCTTWVEGMRAIYKTDLKLETNLRERDLEETETQPRAWEVGVDRGTYSPGDQRKREYRGRCVPCPRPSVSRSARFSSKSEIDVVGLGLQMGKGVPPRFVSVARGGKSILDGYGGTGAWEIEMSSQYED
ncbi:hypothetical protein B0H13DRAFT_1881019 [Mycena leptocephala]|nr:hypothetical protein B0H13DRAFT_1881019 [Mycena leptocephala]